MTQHLQLPPGRRLDAMVAMCLGWRWYCFRREILVDKDQRRFLESPPSEKRQLLIEPATVDMPLLMKGVQGHTWRPSPFHWSTDDESAFGAALKAGVFNRFYFSKGNGGWHCKNTCLLTEFGAKVARIFTSDTPAHVLCLGILAIQDEGKLDEYATWLEGVE